MAYAGSLIVLVAVLGAFLYWRRRLEEARWFLWTGMAAVVLPFVAMTAGWCLTEFGRQPWIVQGLLKTAQRELAEREHDLARDQPDRVRAALRVAVRRRHLADAALRGPRPLDEDARRGGAPRRRRY